MKITRRSSFAPARRRQLATVVAMLAAGTLSLLGTPANAQVTFTKPIRIIVGQPAGGGTDSIARLLAQGMSDALGQSIVIENRPGAGGTIGNAITASAAPDGYTIMLGEIACLSISPTLYSGTIDPQAAFEPIGLVASNTFALVANPKAGFKDLPDLIAKAKAKPNSISYATPGNGTLQHLAAELFKSSAGISMEHIPYKGGAPATMAVLSGEVPIALIGIPPLVPHIASGKLQPLAVGSSKRVRELFNVPTFAEGGVKDFEAIIWYGLVAPKGTPKDVLAALHAAADKAVAMPTVQAGFAKAGVEPMTSTSEQFASLIKSERTKWEKVIRAANVKVD